MLESLEQEYRRDEDWCGGHDKFGACAETDHVIPLISKHLEQKEAFLKVCPLTALEDMQSKMSENVCYSLDGFKQPATTKHLKQAVTLRLTLYDHLIALFIAN